MSDLISRMEVYAKVASDFRSRYSYRGNDKYPRNNLGGKWAYFDQMVTDLSDAIEIIKERDK